MSTGPHPWQFWIDRGGTFTDLVALAPDGRRLTHKLLSEHPERYADAALQGIADLLQLHADDDTVPAIAAIKMGTTVGTNALLERRGEPTVLAITRGFADALRIGNQSRPDIFALHVQRPEPLYARVTEIGGRLDAQGVELEPLNLELARQDLTACFAEGYRALAIVLLHAWRNPAHEEALERIARAIGFTQVSVSHRCSPAIRLVSRGDTTVVDAYLSPVLRHYVGQLLAGLDRLTRPLPRVSFMQSNGGLVDASHFQGKDSILSGPAGGLVGAVTVARRAGFDKIVTFDMGGTSTDVAHYAGALERCEETRIAGVRLRAPLLNIHTVAAGGGSILHYDGLSFRAGPDSAGANPGPACYRRGGPLCVTDANVMLGKLQPDFFPRVFGPGGDEPIDAERVRAEFSALAQTLHQQSGQKMTPEQVAEGFIAVAVEHMAAAIKKISLERGHDLSDDYTLCAFGAAGGQHACLVAERLGLRRILLHPLAGVLSAYGMGLADHRILREQAWLEPLTAGLEPALTAGFEGLEHAIREEWREQNLSPARVTLRRRLALRYQGADTVLEAPFGPLPGLRPAFEALHQQRFGFIYADKDLIIESLRVEGAASENPGEFESPATGTRQDDRLEPLTRVQMFGGGVWRDTPVLKRETLPVDWPIPGPAMILEPTATTLIEPGWTGALTARGDLILTQAAKPAGPPRAATQRDPARLEIFNRLFMSLAEEMGYTLQNTAHSVNIKERLDFSCALFDGQGALVANAPHIPVHLGSMGESVTALIRRHGQAFRPGDVWLTNSPYDGGTHLPDITVITPLFDEGGQDVLCYLASRGHHADIGGITPGSMPPGSRRIEEEGLLSDGLRIVAADWFQEETLRAWLVSGAHPARNPAQNSADLRAQIAANARGANGLRRLIKQYSLATVQAYMAHVQDYAEASIRRAISRLRDGECRVPLDSGAVIRVSVRVNHETSTAVIDLTGTSPQQADNLNAPAAVCRAAVLYVFRTLAQDDIPLNAGCLRPLHLIIPEGSLLNPRPPAAVVAGNVETSQHLVDALYGALGVLAASQGTMNNLTFGNERHQYYETICGGAGAGCGFPGADAVQTHMTNSRITDPEVLEWRFPVRLECFAIRRGSGGAGRWRGGDGVVRRLRFLEPMAAGILSTRRRTAPFGLEGGESGLPGRNLWIREGRDPVTLEGRAELCVQAGDILQIETPGGGAYGKPGD
ncbi:MAG: hydantoinase B/oxoprolinase family protein [Methylococcus sp.]